MAERGDRECTDWLRGTDRGTENVEKGLDRNVWSFLEIERAEVGATRDRGRVGEDMIVDLTSHPESDWFRLTARWTRCKKRYFIGGKRDLGRIS